MIVMVLKIEIKYQIQFWLDETILHLQYPLLIKNDVVRSAGCTWYALVFCEWLSTTSKEVCHVGFTILEKYKTCITLKLLFARLIRENQMFHWSLIQ